MKYIFIAILALHSGSVLCNEYDKGEKAFLEGDFDTALRIFENIVTDPKAQYGLGIMHMYGLGVETDYKVAEVYLEMSAKTGHPSAQCYLGVLYLQG